MFGGCIKLSWMTSFGAMKTGKMFANDMAAGRVPTPHLKGNLGGGSALLSKGDDLSELGLSDSHSWGIVKTGSKPGFDGG
jgi:hypothetical protein